MYEMVIDDSKCFFYARKQLPQIIGNIEREQDK